MAAKRYHVCLTAEERDRLQDLLNHGTAAARTLTHARILLKADKGPDGPHARDAVIAVAIEVSESTVERVRKRYASEGLRQRLCIVRRSTRNRARLMARVKRISSPSPVVLHPPDAPAGAYACWRRSS